MMFLLLMQACPFCTGEQPPPPFQKEPLQRQDTSLAIANYIALCRDYERCQEDEACTRESIRKARNAT